MENQESNDEDYRFYFPLLFGEIAFLLLTIYHMIKYGYKFIFLSIIIISLLIIIATIFYIVNKEALEKLIKILLEYYTYGKDYILYKYYYTRFQKITFFFSALFSPVLKKIESTISLFKILIINTLFYIKKGIKYLFYKNPNENYLKNNNNTEVKDL